MRLILVTAVALSAAAQAPTPATFDVASIKINKEFNPANRATWTSRITALPGSLTMRNVNMTMIVAWAYHVQRAQVSGPSSMDSQRYDIAAKADHPAKDDEIRLMLQSLLGERFTCKSHRVTKDAEVLALVLPKQGTHKMTPSAVTEGEVQGTHNSDGSDTVKGAVLSEMMDDISRDLEIPVVDITGLHGRFDFTVNIQKYITEMRARYTNESNVPPEAVLRMNLMENIVAGELGLRVETRKAPVEFIVIDSVSTTPAEN